MNKSILKGFKFGMLLQIAVGPICLLIFQTAVSSGFLVAETGVLGVTIVDGLFILAAIFGMGTILNRSTKAKTLIKYFGAIILMIFGLSNITGAFGESFIPSFNFINGQTMESVLVKTMILTLSNPLTILFWAGVFSTKIVEDNMNSKDMYLFGLGAVISTLLFLTLVAAGGSMATNFISWSYINLLNIIVGALLIAFGVKTAINKN